MANKRTNITAIFHVCSLPADFLSKFTAQDTGKDRDEKWFQTVKKLAEKEEDPDHQISWPAWNSPHFFFIPHCEEESGTKVTVLKWP